MISLVKLLTEFYNPDEQAVLQDLKRKFDLELIGRGDYGAVYKIKGQNKAIKITTDEVEIEHAFKLEGKKTQYLIPIYNVSEPKNGIGVIITELLSPTSVSEAEIEEFIPKATQEAVELGIPEDELDIHPGNIMKDFSGDLKLIDV